MRLSSDFDLLMTAHLRGINFADADEHHVAELLGEQLLDLQQRREAEAIEAAHQHNRGRSIRDRAGPARPDSRCRAWAGCPLRVSAPRARHGRSGRARRSIRPTSALVITIVTHPPWLNFRASVMSRIDSVKAHPMPLMSSLCAHPRSVLRTLHQCALIPSCDSVKVTNTLIAYSTTSRSTLAPVPMRTASGRDTHRHHAVLGDQARAQVREAARQPSIMRHRREDARTIDEAGLRRDEKQRALGDQREGDDRSAEAPISRRRARTKPH